LELWHKRLCHINTKTIVEMGKLNTVNDLPNFGNQAHMEACEGCATGKSTVAPIPKGPRQRASQKLEEIHSDVCGPFPTPTTQGFR
ncbi:hypothetical protein ROZALSC1DRAFT_7338, partial [Rozella allomycis CSF55]